MRRAILHELPQPLDPDPPPPVDILQAVSRAIVVKASQGDMTAAEEVLDAPLIALDKQGQEHRRGSSR
jgi:hypothetical protein